MRCHDVRQDRLSPQNHNFSPNKGTTLKRTGFAAPLLIFILAVNFTIFFLKERRLLVHIYVIDGYNLAHKIPEVARFLKKKDFYSAIDRLVHIVQSRLNVRRNRVIIVFDGKKGVFAYPHNTYAVEIRFSRKPQEADDVIRELLRHQSDTSNWIVISSDNEILKTARDLGAHFIRSESFYQTSDVSKHHDAARETKEKYNPQNIDLDYWLTVFGSDENDDK